MYDPDAASAKALALPERAAALRAWEDAWGALEGTFWKGRAPNLCVALPPPSSSSSSSSSFFLSSARAGEAAAVPRVRHISARIVDPDPEPGPLVWLGGDFGDGGLHGVLDEEDHFSFGPWFIAATRDGMNVRASYSYLDLHGCLGGGEEAPGGKERSDVDGDRGVDYDRAYWTVVKVPVWNVVAFALSTELDLAVVISCVFIFFHSNFFFRPFLSFWDTKQYSTAKIERQDHEDEERRTRTHLAVRPLRFLDGTPHPCAKVPTIRFSLTSASAVCISQAQVLGDYILLWVWPGEDDYSLSKLYLIAWKHGSITLVSIHFLSYTGLWW